MFLHLNPNQKLLEEEGNVNSNSLHKVGALLELAEMNCWAWGCEKMG